MIVHRKVPLDFFDPERHVLEVLSKDGRVFEVDKEVFVAVPSALRRVRLREA